MMETLFWIGVCILAAAFIFCMGYLFAAREFGKDVKFYKDCVNTLRVQIQGHIQEIQTLKRFGNENTKKD